jgi:hypothetical protein
VEVAPVAFPLGTIAVRVAVELVGFGRGPKLSLPRHIRFRSGVEGFLPLLIWEVRERLPQRRGLPRAFLTSRLTVVVVEGNPEQTVPNRQDLVAHPVVARETLMVRPVRRPRGLSAVHSLVISPAAAVEVAVVVLAAQALLHLA